MMHSARIIWTFYKNRKEMEELFVSNANIDRQSYYRLLGLGLFDLLVTLPNSVLFLVIDLLERKDSFVFWPGWRAVHADFSSIPVATYESWSSHGIWCIFFVKWSQWVNPLYAVVFFVLFGLSSQARERYQRAFRIVCTPLGRRCQDKPSVSDIAFESNQRATTTCVSEGIM